MVDSCRITIDAICNSSEFGNFNECTSKAFGEIYSFILDEFTIDDYKSMLFLLIDYKIKLEDFLYLVKKEKTYLKNKLLKINLDERTFIECLGTMKMYRELKYFDTCYHVFESKKQDFNEICEIWKTLYALCEEITDDDLQTMKEKSNILDDDILSAEEWFCWAIKRGIIKTTDISQLKHILTNTECLNIINSYRGPMIPYYKVRISTTNSCGIALIFNFEHFNRLDLKERRGSQVDVDSLETLWKTFGFETHIFNDLPSSEVLTRLKELSNQDLSRYDVFTCCILSHGASNVIYASDGKTIPIHELVAIVSSCKSLNEKPKLFFIQACQGPNLMITEGCNDIQQSCVPIDPTRFPIGIDVYIAVATLNGFASFRSPTEGTWFVQALCEALMKYTDNNCPHSLPDIMTLVTQDVAKKVCQTQTGEKAKQIVPTFSTLQKLLLFKKPY